MTSTAAPLPLEGTFILDSAHQFPGPYCTMLLADLGADVLKVERPGVGDPARQFVPFFRSLNRNKRSLTLNLKEGAAQEIVRRLASDADVFVEGFRPGVTTRLGIDYPALREINPRLVYCSISGYGQDGPYRDLPGHDLNYQAMAGMLELYRDARGDPTAPGLAVGDLSSAMFGVIGILGALMARGTTGRGQHVDVSMFDGLVSWMGTNIGVRSATRDAVRTPGGRRAVGGDPGYGLYRDRDGRYLTLGIAHEDWFWSRLCSALGLEDESGLNGLERRERREELAAKLQDVFSTKPREEWIELLAAADVPVAPMRTIDELPFDPHVMARDLIQEMPLPAGGSIDQVRFPIRLSETPGTIRTPPPELGEHTEAVLQDLGYSADQISELRDSGCI